MEKSHSSTSKTGKPWFILDSSILFLPVSIVYLLFTNYKESNKIYSVDEVESLFLKRTFAITYFRPQMEENEGGAVNMTRMSFQTPEADENVQLQIIELKKKMERLKEECANKSLCFQRLDF